MTELILTIHDVGQEGDGIAKHEGSTLFVEGALTGERVRVKYQETKKGPQKAQLLEILEKSKNRTAPICPHFGRCGGCRLQHMGAELYESHKRQNLIHLLEKSGFDAALLRPTITTPSHSRRRARFAAKRTKNGVIIGFNEKASHNVIPLEACPVLLPRFEELLPGLAKHLEEWLPKSCDLQISVLPHGVDVLIIGGTLDMNARMTLAAMAEDLDIAHLSWQAKDFAEIEPIAHRKPLPVTFGETNLPFPPGSFLQASETGERALTNFAKEYAGEAKNVLDLFSGLGTFGLSLEGEPNLHFSDIDGAAMDLLETLAKSHGRFQVTRRNLLKDPFTYDECNEYDLVIFDPPRGGAKAQAEELAQSDVKNIVAISCDPPRFMRDAKILCDGGYRLTSLQPVDQFLFSTHMELAAHFECD